MRAGNAKYRNTGEARRDGISQGRGTFGRGYPRANFNLAADAEKYSFCTAAAHGHQKSSRNESWPTRFPAFCTPITL